MKRRTVCAVTVALLISLNAAAAPPQRTSPITGPVEQLRGAVLQHGVIRIIIGVAVPGYTPEGRLNAFQVAAQRENIRAAQQRVIDHHPRASLPVGRRYATVPALAVDVDAATLDQLAADNDVTSVEDDTIMVPALRDTTALIDMLPVWLKSYDGSGFAVAIFDTGVYRSHTFFATNRVSLTKCFSSDNSSAGITSSCASPDDGDPCAVADCYHGTIVAGVAAGHTMDAVGTGELSGVARGASIMSFKLASVQNGTAVFQKSDVVAALDYISQHYSQFFSSLAAINMSFIAWPGSPAYLLRNSTNCATTPACSCDNSQLQQAVAQVSSAGIAVVAGTGNNSNNALRAPACVPGVIAVAATTKNDAFWLRSDATSEIDLLAPGAGWTGNDSTATDGIFASVMSYQFLGPPDPTAYSQIVSSVYNQGTSLASPHVAGAIAVLRQIYPFASLDVPGLTAKLVSTGKTVHIYRPGNLITLDFDAKRINVAAAADQRPPAAPMNVEAHATGSTSVTVSWQASTDDIGVQSYTVYRLSVHNGTATALPDVAGNVTTLTDNSAPSAAALGYYAVAHDYAGNASPASATDVATTVMYSQDPLLPRSDVVKGAHVAELRQAIDAWRVYAGLGRVWTNYPPLTGSIYASDFYDAVNNSQYALVNALNAALTALGRSSFGYSGIPTPAVGGLIYAGHVQQLRGAMK